MAHITGPTVVSYEPQPVLTSEQVQAQENLRTLELLAIRAQEPFGPVDPKKSMAVLRARHEFVGLRIAQGGSESLIKGLRLERNALCWAVDNLERLLAAERRKLEEESQDAATGVPLGTEGERDDAMVRAEEVEEAECDACAEVVECAEASADAAEVVVRNMFMERRAA